MSPRSKMTLFILAGLASTYNGKAAARLIRDLVSGYFEEKSEDWGKQTFKERTFRNCLSRLYKAGLVKKESWGVWSITAEGKNFVKVIEEEKKQSKVPDGPPDTIVIFDIPEKQRIKRDTLRVQLMSLGFNKLQKSVFLGHGPLPEDFIRYLSDLEILENIHIFSIKERGTIV